LIQLIDVQRSLSLTALSQKFVKMQFQQQGNWCASAVFDTASLKRTTP